MPNILSLNEWRVAKREGRNSVAGERKCEHASSEQPHVVSTRLHAEKRPLILLRKNRRAAVKSAALQCKRQTNS